VGADRLNYGSVTYDYHLPPGISNLQSLNRGNRTAANVIQTFTARRTPQPSWFEWRTRHHLPQPLIRMAPETTEVTFVKPGYRFGHEAENAPDNFAGLPGAQEVTRNQYLGAVVAREAKCEFTRLKASGIGQRDVIGIAKASPQICLGLAMTDQNDFASRRPFHNSCITPHRI
jgi:hypothetical protein